MLFVYGTLRSGERNRHKIEPFIRSSAMASVAGTLFLYDDAEHICPFLAQGGGGRVVGELVELENEEEALPKIDAFEGPNYVRAVIDVQTEDGRKVRAWTYLMAWERIPANAQIIEAGDYSKFTRVSVSS